MRRFFFWFGLIWCLVASMAQAQQALTGLARLTGDGIVLKERLNGLELDLDLSQSVPWRVFTLDNPRRLVLDFSEVDWTGPNAEALSDQADRVLSVAMGTYRPGWSRLVLELSEPMRVTKSGMSVSDTGAHVAIKLHDSDQATFDQHVGAPESALFRDAEMAPPPAPKLRDGPLVVVLDPGHGGIDPGAERDGAREKDITLAFARELKEVLLRAGNIDVVLTRDDDVFVPLETRVTIARRAGADVFLSLHADALAQGRAHGATVYTLADDASDAASEKLAERHDRADLLAGVDLSDSDDAVALLLMDMARTETAPRSEALADALVEGLYSATQSTYKTPKMHAAFSVLKAPDIPSALIELGFLSSERDREKMMDPEWRRNAAEGIRDALFYWAIEDDAMAARLRK